ncbi:Putative rRNA maturation factor [Croceitalea dokdonensis DOKDO 023]|uniref:Endoribonuclease YbeY n=1 Tax=Croceitalea dokdonensis DOKDO 023 TaxID=1300341 RepID=A0A0P7ASL5_9FLAO|nr:rRNA maturation RNase YbeY [Croceitalea dokdonensis]KPM30937.1 Putative rRNA maturation factor [Croceitalea dokdonensis DOKDO 023]
MAISFHYETKTEVEEIRLVGWLTRVIETEGKELGEISFIFCDDGYLLKLNQDFLSHDTLTDVITFDYTEGKFLGGDIFISVERVEENAKELVLDFEEELRRVMVHGVLHLCGYKDKDVLDMKVMRKKEEEKLKMFHVEQ